MKKKEKVYWGLVQETGEKIDNIKLSDYKTKNISWLDGFPEKIEMAVAEKQIREADGYKYDFWNKEVKKELEFLDICLYPTRDKRDIVKLELKVYDLEKIHNSLINIPCPVCKDKKWYQFWK